MKNKDKKVLVALSGGVDSSVAALLLKRAGFNVVGGFIRGYNVDGCQDRDAEDARLVAEKLDIPFYVFDFEEEYKKRVVNYLLDGYRKGITPNPDVVCNSQIKFGLFYDKAMELGFDYVASGHYVRMEDIGFRGKRGVFEAKDKNKDQSYFLWQIPYERFNKILFPIGHLKKMEVRKIAKEFGLPTADKKDSQGVCFLGKFRFGDFLKEHIKPEKGEIVDTNGKKVGEHHGVWFYTIGQRSGFTINQTSLDKQADGTTITKQNIPPFYVIAKKAKENQLVVGFGAETYVDKFKVEQLHWIAKPSQFTPHLSPLYVRLRHTGKLLPCKLQLTTHNPPFGSVYGEQSRTTQGKQPTYCSSSNCSVSGRNYSYLDIIFV